MSQPPSDPFHWLAPRARRPAFVALSLLALGLMGALQRIGAPLTNPAAPAGIVSFELAGSAAAAAAIVASWDEAARVAAGLSLGLDYLFMAAYAGAIGLGCALTGEGLARRGLAAPARLGRWLAWGLPLAALLDAVENVALIRLLGGVRSDFWAALARWCAIPKFALVALGLLFALAGGLALVFRRR